MFLELQQAQYRLDAPHLPTLLKNGIGAVLKNCGLTFAAQFRHLHPGHPHVPEAALAHALHTTLRAANLMRQQLGALPLPAVQATPAAYMDYTGRFADGAEKLDHLEPTAQPLMWQANLQLAAWLVAVTQAQGLTLPQLFHLNPAENAA